MKRSANRGVPASYFADAPTLSAESENRGRSAAHTAGAARREAAGESDSGGISPASHAGVGVNEASAGAGHGVRTGFAPTTFPAAAGRVALRRAVAMVGISARAICPAGSFSAVRGGRCHAE